MKIIIDAGHGGDDPGAVAFGMLEKDFNFIFANKLADALASKGYEVDTSLINDENYDPDELCSLIVESQAALCISCHNNAANGNARGLEVIHSIHSEGTLANDIITKVADTGYNVRTAYSRASYIYADTDYYFIIRQTYPDIETVIIEFGFMDNEEDYNLLITEEWQDTLTEAVAEAVSNYIPIPKETKTPILGDSLVSAYKLKSALADKNSEYDSSIVDEYLTIGQIYGVRGDLAFCQCLIETNWLMFTGIVNSDQNNFAGLGATGSGVSGASFSTLAEGIEAHIQHLYAYASIDTIPDGRSLIDPRFSLVTRGIAPNYEDLNGRWAVPGVGYGERIVSVFDSIDENYSDPLVVDEPVEEHWAKPCNDELMAAGILNSDHSSTLDQPASEGMVICIANRLRKEIMKDE